MNALRFREVRCGFLEAVCQEYLEKEFPIRSIPLVKGPGNWRENYEPEFNNHEIYERVLFSVEGYAIQRSEMWLSLGSVPGVSGEGIFHKEHSFGEKPGQLARER